MVDINKRLKFTKFVKKAVGVGLLAGLAPQAFAGYVFKDNSNNTILKIDSNTKDVVVPAIITTNSKTITYDGNGDIATVVNGNRTWAYTWSAGDLQSITDGGITKTFVWTNGDLTAVNVTGGL